MTVRAVAAIGRRLGGWAVGPPAAAPVAARNAGFASASANAFALSNRSAGSFSSALATAAATLGGTDLRSLVTGCASSVDDLHDDLLRRAADVRRIAGEHLVQHAAERVDVGPRR